MGGLVVGKLIKAFSTGSFNKPVTNRAGAVSSAGLAGGENSGTGRVVGQKAGIVSQGAAGGDIRGGTSGASSGGALKKTSRAGKGSVLQDGQGRGKLLGN